MAGGAPRVHDMHAALGRAQHEVPGRAQGDGGDAVANGLAVGAACRHDLLLHIYLHGAPIPCRPSAWHDMTILCSDHGREATLLSPSTSASIPTATIAITTTAISRDLDPFSGALVNAQAAA